MSPQTLQKEMQRFTWQDYQNWPADERWELIGGVAYAMSPAPTIKHQSVAGEFFFRLRQHFGGKPCQPFIAPVDVRLSDLDVVQPDVLVVCDRNKITPTHIEGAPDVVLEVLSPATAAKDQREKKALYERAGVREYVVVQPLDHYAIRFLLLPETGRFDQGTLFSADEFLVFATLENLEIPLWEVFEVPRPGETVAPKIPSTSVRAPAAS
ncbi:MAG: Uma2 family endonuclease [Rhodocyclaceae bacterium]|nr:Uma2 family endonuclease [Rhodocyclaceae bacterium]